MTKKNMMNYLKDMLSLEQVTSILGSSKTRDKRIVFYLRLYSTAVSSFSYYLSRDNARMVRYIKKMKRDISNPPAGEQRHMKKINEQINKAMKYAVKKPTDIEIKDALKIIQGICVIRMLSM